MSSNVYFTSMNTNSEISLLDKFKKLLIKAGINSIDFENKFTAIKVHFGEPGNLAYIRPNYAKTLVDLVRDFKGRPFLTDCNTLYVGKRKNALEHLETAYVNGFNPFVTGCHVIIGDGLKGTDEKLIPINMKHVKEAKIGHAIADSDVIISLSHFKGHVATGIGGALKNIGMGCGSRAGKMEMHSSGKPVVKTEKCTGCFTCMQSCAHDAISDIDSTAYINHELCVGCGRCIGSCLFDAIVAANDETNTILTEKIAEYTYAVLSGKQHFHISFVIDISPFCDCYSSNDVPIVDDIGIFASFDPVALDKACTDQVNAGRVVKGSILDNTESFGDHIRAIHPATDWLHGLTYASDIGLGSLEYNLISVE